MKCVRDVPSGIGFFGHYHSNMVIEKKYAMLYEQIIRLK